MAEKEDRRLFVPEGRRPEEFLRDEDLPAYYEAQGDHERAAHHRRSAALNAAVAEEVHSRSTREMEAAKAEGIDHAEFLRLPKAKQAQALAKGGAK